MKSEIPFQFYREHGRYLLGGEPMLFHCHYYNIFLQRSILDADYIQSQHFLIGAAAEVAYAQLSRLFKEKGIDSVEQRKRLGMSIYRRAGFGLIDLFPITENGGIVSTDSSIYAMAWTEHFGLPKKPVCYFISGWLAGALSAIYDLPDGVFTVQESDCVGMNGKVCSFFVSRSSEPGYAVYKSVEAGDLSKPNLIDPLETSADYEGIIDAVLSINLEGDQRGQIPIFGVYLNRMYANYYNRISFEFEREIIKKFEDTGRKVVRSLFKEAGHVCAFNTFGGIMTSREWDALVLPGLKTREDWVHGITACVNALGWGIWQVAELSEKQAVFVIHDDYESSGYLAMLGRADHHISYLSEGAAAGIMNLVYYGDVASKPTFSPKYYNQLFKSEGSFQTEVLSSKAMGEETTSFRVYKD